MNSEAVPLASSPRVSVVMASYNRSNIIGHAIRSLQAQTVKDWELWVIGDACTDDTGQVVEAFADPRIRFVNLERNFGEQSRPNNEGVARARGQYLAFLNQDDIWLPHHLEACMRTLEKTRADLVYSVGFRILSDPDWPLLAGATIRSQDYDPNLGVPASLWVMRRELMAQVGGWRPATQVRTLSSHDWLYRAWRSGARLKGLPELTALLLQSGTRKDSYRLRESVMHERVLRRLQDPGYLVQAALNAARVYEDLRLAQGGGRLFVHAVHSAIAQLCLKLGLFPNRPAHWMFWRKGSAIRHLRRVRGLPPAPF